MEQLEWKGKLSLLEGMQVQEPVRADGWGPSGVLTFIPILAIKKSLSIGGTIDMIEKKVPLQSCFFLLKGVKLLLSLQREIGSHPLTSCVLWVTVFCRLA